MLVYGILERKSRVRVLVVPKVQEEIVLGQTVEIVWRGSIVYTDRYQIYAALMFGGYRHLRVGHHTHFSLNRGAINDFEGFWSYSKERLTEHHGLSREKLPLYLTELEFHCNHRAEALFPLLASYLCDFGPNVE